MLAGVYAVALGVGFLVAEASLGRGLLVAALLGDLAATGVVFLAAVSLDNTSVYDPYWSVAPLPLALWWYCHAGAQGAADPVRFGLAAALLGLWGARLTANFGRGWRGLAHEDWRYSAYRRLGTVRYWLVSLAGLQLLPTLVVFAALLPVYALTREPGNGPNLLDALAALVALAALTLETAADEQKRRRRGVCPGRVRRFGSLGLVPPPQLPGGGGLLVGSLRVRPRVGLGPCLDGGGSGGHDLALPPGQRAADGPADGEPLRGLRRLFRLAPGAAAAAPPALRPAASTSTVARG